MKIPNPRLILIILTAFVSISTNAMSEDNMFRQVTFADENLTVKHELLFKHLDANTPDLARSIAIDLVNDVTNDTSVDGVTYAKVLTNAAVLDSVFGNYSAASASLDEAITLMEKPNQFNLNLFRVLMARGYVYASDENYVPPVGMIMGAIASNLTHYHGIINSPNWTDGGSILSFERIGASNEMQHYQKI
ncbi:MAG TPA: hypothetical protein EYQ00_03310, partial [Dehalococcoidia bacterium]|nr:hypothetical protein [Dehalococcoidia bacterium]